MVTLMIKKGKRTTYDNIVLRIFCKTKRMSTSVLNLNTILYLPQLFIHKCRNIHKQYSRSFSLHFRKKPRKTCRRYRWRALRVGSATHAVPFTTPLFYPRVNVSPPPPHTTPRVSQDVQRHIDILNVGAVA